MPVTVRLTEKGKQYIEEMKKKHGVDFFIRQNLMRESIKKLAEMPEKERNNFIVDLLIKKEEGEE